MRRHRCRPFVGVLAAALPVLAWSTTAAAGAAEMCLEFLEHHVGDEAWRQSCLDALAEASGSAGESGAEAAALDASSGSVIPLGSNVNVSRLTGNHQETAIAIDPTNSNRMFAFSNTELLPFGMFAKYSTDAGATWNFVNTHGDVIDDGCCDPSASWDEFGNLFISYIRGANFNPPFPTLVALSTNGGQSFTRLAIVGGDTDYPTIATGPGSVWLTYKDFSLPGWPIVAQGAAVTGLGAVGSFGAPQPMPSSTDCFFGDIAVGPQGQVLVNCQTGDDVDGPSEILVSIDADGLGPGGFAAPYAERPITNVGADDHIPAQPERLISAQVSLAYDRSGGPHDGRVYLLYTDETPNESQDTDVVLRSSDDDGATWSTPIRVNDDATSRSQFLPAIAVDQSTGQVAVSWHDCRHDDGTPPFSWPDPPGSETHKPNNDAMLFASLSWDGGATFAQNAEMSFGDFAIGVSDEDGSQPPGGSDDLDYGDYTALAFVDGRFHPAWADNSNSTGDNPDANPDGTPSRMEVYTIAEPARALSLAWGVLAVAALRAIRVGSSRRSSRSRRATCMTVGLVCSTVFVVPRIGAAESITFGFEGVVTSLVDRRGDLDGSVSVGSRFTGQYTFDSDVSGPGVYEYTQPPNGIRVDIGSYRFQSDPLAPNFRIEVGGAGGVDDSYTVRSRGPNESIGPPLDLRINDIGWFLQDPTDDPFASDELPTTPFPLDVWGLNVLLIQGCDPRLIKCRPLVELDIRGEVTSLFLVPGPEEPETLVGLRIGRRGVAFEVVGQGPACTRKDDFHVEIFGDDPLRLLLVRDGPDPGTCGHEPVFRQHIPFSFEELGLVVGDRIEVVNPIEIDSLRAPRPQKHRRDGGGHGGGG